MMKNKINELIKNGVKILDPDRLDIRGELDCGLNVEIDINVIFNGKVSLGDNVKVGAHCIITNSNIGNGTEVKPYSLIEGANIGENGFVGPFVRIREGSFIGSKVQLGNFVEIKNVQIGDGCRINHMTFLGDSVLGDNVTIGAGSITCNYDGATTHKTTIESDVFIGSGTNLIAPLNVGRKATIGSGSTITDDVPPDKLTLARERQVTVQNWKGVRNITKDK
jgi:bifunctional UDP-N-acetylglucosamine pyrophosphorylase/glucosamine-1-phosphate N-acetyltransferase